MDEIVSLPLDDTIIPLLQRGGLAVRIIKAWIINIRNSFHSQKEILAEHFTMHHKKSLLSEIPFICSAIPRIEHLTSGGGPF